MAGGLAVQDQDEAQFPVRVPWTWAPVRLRQRVSELLGSDEVASADVRGGMSPGPAAVLSLADGRQVFAKAVSAQVNAASHELYLWEAAALRALPVDVPAPDLLGLVQDGDWIALITSFSPGTAAGPPWSTATIQAVADACQRLAAHRAPTGIPPVIDRLPDLDGWAKLAAGEAGPLDSWEARHVEQLARLSDGWRDWTRGTALLHHDLRCDNAIVDAHTGQATLVDWSYCTAGAPWLDRALLAADVMAAGHLEGPTAALEEATELLASAPAEASRFVVAQAGMWRRNSTLPCHPGMPSHRTWQRARALALRPLLSSLLRTRQQGL